MPKIIRPGMKPEEMFPYCAEAECPQCHMAFQLEVGDGWWMVQYSDGNQIAVTSCPNDGCTNSRVSIPNPERIAWAKAPMDPPSDRTFRDALAQGYSRTPGGLPPEATDDSLADPDDDEELDEGDLGGAVPPDRQRELPEEVVERARQAAIEEQEARGRGQEIGGMFIPYEEQLERAAAARRSKDARAGRRTRSVAPLTGKIGDEIVVSSTEVRGVRERGTPGVGRKRIDDDE